MDFISDNLALSDDDAQNWSDNNSDEPVPSPVISRRGSVSSTSSRASEPPDDSDDDYATSRRRAFFVRSRYFVEH
jgi:hypothetical protein